MAGSMTDAPDAGGPLCHRAQTTTGAWHTAVISLVSVLASSVPIAAKEGRGHGVGKAKARKAAPPIAEQAVVIFELCNRGQRPSSGRT